MEPIACNVEILGNQGDPNGRATQLLAKLTNPIETPHGYRFQLPADDVGEVGAWIAEERLCCSFFDFDLSLKADSGQLELTLGGGAGVKEFIASEVLQLGGLSLEKGLS